jgi:hypothetical protein
LATTVVWAAVKRAAEPFVSADFEGALIIWGQVEMEFTGLEGMRKASNGLPPWTSYYDETEDFFAVGDDRVIALGRQHGYRLDTEAEVVAETAGVYLVRDGKIARASTTQTKPKRLQRWALQSDPRGVCRSGRQLFSISSIR